MQFERPGVEVRDVIVRVNLAINHHDGGQILEKYFEKKGF